MRRTFVFLALFVLSVAAAAFAGLRGPLPSKAGLVRPPVAPATSGGGPLRVTAQLERRWLDPRGASQYLEIDVAADGPTQSNGKAAVNAVMVIDRSGSMAGAKIERARDAARELVLALDGEDRLAIVDFASDATVLLPSTRMTPGERERALALIQRLQPTSGTNFSGAFDLAAPQLRAGRGGGRVEKVFFASDGQVNEGVTDRRRLLQLAADRFEGAAVSTFGVGEDYDEELMTALASQAGGRTRFIARAEELAPAFRAELSRAAQVVARDVRLEVLGEGGARVERILGFALQADGSVRLPDFSAGESRRVMVKLRLPAGSGEARLAHVAVRCEDARGERFGATAEALGAYTNDARLLRAEAGEAAIWGANAEMADVAQEAVRAQERGDQAAASRNAQRLDELEAQAQAARPSAAPKASGFAAEWRGLVGQSASGGAAQRKEAKQRAFDAANAPVAGW